MTYGRVACSLRFTTAALLAGGLQWAIVCVAVPASPDPFPAHPAAASIKLANDFFTVNVSPTEPVSLEELRQQELQLQQEAAAVLQRGAAQGRRPQAGYKPRDVVVAIAVRPASVTRKTFAPSPLTSIRDSSAPGRTSVAAATSRARAFSTPM